jgi:hypothetical protein
MKYQWRIESIEWQWRQWRNGVIMGESGMAA